MSWRARRLLTVALAVLLTLALAAGLACWYLSRQVADIPRFTAGPAVTTGPHPHPVATPAALELPLPADGAPQSYLVVSVGAAGMSARAGAAIGVPDVAQRDGDGLTDIIMDVLVDPRTGRAALLSIPRDTWVSSCGCKINALLKLDGAAALTREVTRRTGVPVNHLLSLNFAAFADLTNAIGGVGLYVDRPLRDDDAHLLLPTPGCVHFTGRTALAFVRSRHTQTLRHGVWVADPSASDFGRIERQHLFLTAAAAKVLTASLAWKAPTYLHLAQANLRLDARLSAANLLGLARALQGGASALSTASLPSTVGWVGRASVVFTDPAAAGPVLAHWRTAGGVGTAADRALLAAAARPALAGPAGPSAASPAPGAAGPGAPGAAPAYGSPC